MGNRANKGKFAPIWSRFVKNNQIATVSLTEVEAFATQKGLRVKKISEVSFGSFSKIDGILLETDVGKAIYPRQQLEDLDWYARRAQLNKNYEEFWADVDWFIPPFIALGKIYDDISQAGINIPQYHVMQKGDLQARFEYALPSLYDFSNIIPITAQTLPDSQAIRKHLPVITEAIFSFYSGMKVAAIAALIPIIEDILNSIIGNGATSLDLVAKVNKSIDLAYDAVIKYHLDGADWVPEHYIEKSVLKVLNERALVLETIRYWLTNSFYANTENYTNHSGFNRHFFAHAKSDIWQNSNNFFRALGLIQALAFIECFAMAGSKVSIFPPNLDERSESLRREVFCCLNMQLFKKEIIAKMQDENNLPFNPISSDDGWLYRAAILADTMNDEIIASLRAKGWQCHSFTDPIAEGEYITVSANKAGKTLHIALLYSCASDNSLYRELDQHCDFILYRGSYYKQESFTQGVKTTVLPLNAWIAPD